MRFFSTLFGGLAASFFVLLLPGCGGGTSAPPPPPPGPVEVTVSMSGSGTGAVTSTPAGIDCGTTCTHTFTEGTQVTLTATPTAGFSFGGWSGACTGTGACTLATSGAQSVAASFTASLQSINHIIFMAQENRGFDHYFGHLNDYRVANGLPADVDGTPANASNPSADGLSIVTPFLMNSVCVENQSPSWNESHTQYNRQDPLSAIATMDGFVYISSKDAPSNGGFDLEGTRAMGYYDQTLLPYYYFMATNFATSDRWFAPLLSRTHPNRMYLMAGTSTGHVYPLPPGAPPLTNKTIFELLDENNISWKVYVTNSNSPDPLAGTLFSMYAYAQGPGLQNIVPATEFLTDAANGTLPQVAMIEPGYGVSDSDEHPATNTPGGSVQRGSAYVASLINGLMQTPSWSDSVFMLTWDEGGGFYDHVAPVTTVSPDGIPPSDLAGPPAPDLCYGDTTHPTCDFIYTGFRVPMILVSPYANKNSVSHVARDHTSILKLIEQRFNLPSLTARDAAQPNMDEFFDFVNPPWRTPPTPPTQLQDKPCYIDHLP